MYFYWRAHADDNYENMRIKLNLCVVLENDNSRNDSDVCIVYAKHISNIFFVEDYCENIITQISSDISTL